MSNSKIIRLTYSAACILQTFVLHVGTVQAAAVQTDMHNFPPINTEGTSNYLGGSTFIAGPNGALYGAALGGDLSSAVSGVVFRLTPPGGNATAWTFTDLHDFPNIGVGTPNLSANLVADGSGVLYGTTAYGTTLAAGGGVGAGSVFRLSPPQPGQTSWAYEELYRPSASGIGAYPDSLVMAGGSLYGTGGCDNEGCVFRLTPPAPGHSGWQPSLVHVIPGTGISTLIAREVGGVLALFGEGSASASVPNGNIFMLTAPATASQRWTYTVLHTFEGPDGSYPLGGLIADRALNLYGVTELGGPSFAPNGGAFGSGVVFRLSPPAAGQSAWSFSELYAFKGPPTGAYPSGGLVAAQGSLYGVARTGGVGCTSVVGCSATLFRVTPRDYGGHAVPWNETVAFDYLPNLATPAGGLLLDASNPDLLAFYGFAGGYGTDALGFAYRLTLTP